MRLLAAHNIFLEMGAGSQWFANNRVSLRIDSKEALAKLMGDHPYVNTRPPGRLDCTLTKFTFPKYGAT